MLNRLCKRLIGGQVREYKSTKNVQCAVYQAKTDFV